MNSWMWRAIRLLSFATLAWGCDSAPAFAPPDAAYARDTERVDSPDAASDFIDPAHWEFCDGFDNDLDGLVDEVECPERYNCFSTDRCRCAEGYERCGAECVSPNLPHAMCGGTCAVLQSDIANCGACGNACPESTRCVRGTCSCEETLCDGVCSTLASDNANCGACGHACAATEYCAGGRCVCRRTCGTVCVDANNDPSNCGFCGRRCPSDAPCVAGVCACPVVGFRPCAEGCTDTTSDPRNCGACGYECSPIQRCVRGACTCPAELTDCGSCVDLQSANAHCGECFHACPSGAACVAGACACTDPRTTLCDGACVDVSRSVLHCGACRRPCAPRSTCRDGACVGSPVSPVAGARVSTRRPTFRWSEGDAQVEVCADAACSRVLETLTGNGARGVTTTTTLRPGAYFWRLRASSSAAPGVALPFHVDARDNALPGVLPAVVDLNADGLADVVVATDDRVVTFWGRRGALSTSPDRVDLFPSTLAGALDLLRAVGDVNGDGSTDVTLYYLDAMTGGEERVMLLGAPAPPPTFTRLDPLPSPLLPVGDINVDGIVDWIRLTTNTMYVTLGSASGWTTSSTLLSTTERAVRGVTAGFGGVAQLGDADGDGVNDVALAAPNASPPRVYVLLGSSVGLDRTWTAPPAARSAGFAAWVAGAGDLNGDGRADVLAGYAGEVGAVVYLSSDAGLTPHRTLIDASGDALLVVSAGDIDGDGYFDLVALRRTRDALLYRGGRDGLAAAPVTLSDARWRDAETMHSPGDVDGDGFDDLVVGAPAIDAVYVFHGAAVDPCSRVETLRGEAGAGFGRGAL